MTTATTTANMSKRGLSSLAEIMDDDKYSKKVLLSESGVDELLKKIERSLVEADIPALQARKLTNGVREKLKAAVIESTSKSASTSFRAAGSLNRLDGAESTMVNRHKSEFVKSEIIKLLTELVTPSTPIAKQTMETLLGEDHSSSASTTHCKHLRSNLGASHTWEPAVGGVIDKVSINNNSNVNINANGDSINSAAVRCRPARVLFLGLMGAGKTTKIMQYAYYYQGKGLRVACISADTFRAGASDQTKQNCRKIGMDYYCGEVGDSPHDVIIKGLAEFNPIDYEREDIGGSHLHYDLILIDTAGRFEQSKELGVEMESIVKAAQPDHTLMVVDASHGSAVTKQAIFFSQFAVDGIILTKIDNSNSRGGGAIAAIAATGSPVRFIGVGEGPEDLQLFDPQRYISRILGLGDIKQLMQRLEATERQRRLRQGTKGVEGDNDSGGMAKFTEKMLNGDGKYTFRDFLKQIHFMIDFTNGKVSSIVSLIPGFQKVLNSTLNSVNSADGKSKGKKEQTEADVDEEFHRKVKSAIIICDSMSIMELEQDDSFLYTGSRPRQLKQGKVKTKNANSDGNKFVAVATKLGKIKPGNDDSNFDSVSIFTSRVRRIAKGSGHSDQQVREMIEMFTSMKAVFANIKKLPKNIQEMLRTGKKSTPSTEANIEPDQSKLGKSNKSGKSSKLNSLSAHLDDDGEMTMEGLMGLMGDSLPKNMRGLKKSGQMQEQMKKMIKQMGGLGLK